MSEPQKQHEGNRDYFVLEGRTVKAVPVADDSTARGQCINCCLSWYTNPEPSPFSCDCFEFLRQGLRPICIGRGPGCPDIYFVVTEESLL